MPPFALLYVASGLWHYTASHVNNQTSSVTLLKAMAWAFNLNGHNKEALPQHPELTQNFKRYNCYWDYQLMGDANRKLIETPTANSQSQASNDNQVDNDQPSAAAKTKTTNEAQNEGVMHWCQNKLACKLSVFNHKYAMDSQTYQNVYEEFLNSQPQN